MARQHGANHRKYREDEMSLKAHNCRLSRSTISCRAGWLLASGLGLAPVARGDSPPRQIPSIFEPQSTPADSVFHLALFALVICTVIFVVVFFLIAYSTLKFRARRGDGTSEPPQVYGSNRVELAWTVIPGLIVVVLFLATSRVIHSVQDAPKPPGTLRVTAVGHQFWWEYRHPALGVVTANELHVPVSDPSHRTPTFLRLLSADWDGPFL